MTRKFCYLIQSPDYIPDYVEQLNNKHRVAHILTFKKPINYKRNIFIPAEKCTWTDGRNELAKSVKDKDHLYYIFMDDDIKLSIDERFGNKEDNPWDVFEKFLVDYEPAVGCAHWQKQPIDMKSPVTTLYQYDALFNAVHKDIMPMYFPMYNGFDETSWWWSQLIATHSMAVFCPGTVLQCNSIHVDNPRKGDYPNVLAFGFPGRIFQKSLLRAEDQAKVLVKGFLTYRDNGKYEKPTPAKYKSMIYQARHKVSRHNMLWEKHPFFNFVLQSESDRV